MKSFKLLPFLISVLLFFSCNSKPGTDRKNVPREFGSLVPDERPVEEEMPYLHDSLSRDQVEKLSFLRETFLDVDSSSLESWIDDFRREEDPDGEIGKWMMMANAYNSHCKGKDIPMDEKMEVYDLVVMRYFTPEEEILATYQPVYLNPEEVQLILDQFKNGN